MKRAWLEALKDTLPFVVAYFPLGIVFGYLFHQLEAPWILAPVMSLCVYAGSVQFMALGLLASHGSLFTLVLTALFIGSRNAFYGLSLLDRYQGKGWRKWYLIFGLVDPVYATLVSKPHLGDADQKYCLCLTAYLHATWIAGTFIGAAAGAHFPPLPGLEFILTALFAILLVEQLCKHRAWFPLCVAAGAALVMHQLAPGFEIIGTLLATTLILTLREWRGLTA